MKEQELLLSEHFRWEGKIYLVQVYRYPDGKPRCSHVARTALGPDDYVISDGRSVEEVLHKQQTILPLAILSRSIVSRDHTSKNEEGRHGLGGL